MNKLIKYTALGALLLWLYNSAFKINFGKLGEIEIPPESQEDFEQTSEDLKALSIGFSTELLRELANAIVWLNTQSADWEDLTQTQNEWLRAALQKSIEDKSLNPLYLVSVYKLDFYDDEEFKNLAEVIKELNPSGNIVHSTIKPSGNLEKPEEFVLGHHKIRFDWSEISLDELDELSERFEELLDYMSELGYCLSIHIEYNTIEGALDYALKKVVTKLIPVLQEKDGYDLEGLTESDSLLKSNLARIRREEYPDLAIAGTPEEVGITDKEYRC